MHVYTALIRVSTLDASCGQDVPFSGGGGGSTVDMCREPHSVKISHVLAAFTCQVVPSLGGGFHC